MQGVNVLKREDLLNLSDSFEKEEVKLDRGSVFVRSMSAKMAEQYENFFLKNQNGDSGKIRASLIVKTLCDESGVLQFNDKDIELVSEMPLIVIKPIFDAALNVNKMNVGSGEDAKKN